MKATWRHVLAPSAPVLSYEDPRKFNPSSGIAFHSLHATSQALQPIHTEVSVKKPFRGGGCSQPAPVAGSGDPVNWLTSCLHILAPPSRCPGFDRCHAGRGAEGPRRRR